MSEKSNQPDSAKRPVGSDRGQPGGQPTQPPGAAKLADTQAQHGVYHGFSAASPTGQRNVRRLGRGLASLISIPAPIDAPADGGGSQSGQGGQVQIGQTGQPGSAGSMTSSATPSSAPSGVGTAAVDGPAGPHTMLTQLFVRNIEPNPLQPRRWFDEQSLIELASSIKVNGLVQPVLVRRKSHSDQTLAGEPTFQLVAGERRWRAAKLAGLDVVPAIVKPLADDAMLEIALTENLHRQDLNPIERAGAYRGLIKHRNLSQDAVAERLGESRTSVTNHLRLLELPDDVQELIATGQLSFGQAKPLTGLKQSANQSRLAQVIIRDDWTVRQVERVLTAMDNHAGKEDFLTKLLDAGLGGGLLAWLEKSPGVKAAAVTPVAPVEPAEPVKPANILALEEKLTRRLGTRVLIRQGRRAEMGKVVIDFYCLDDFDRILEALGVSAD